MWLIDAEPVHLPAIHAILNEVIANTTAIYSDQPATTEEAAAWFDGKRAAGFPVIVAVEADDRVLGFASYGEFNPKPGYRYTVEHSVHVAEACRGRGTGRRLLDAIEARARGANRHTMVGLIDAENTASRRLHESAGYLHVGTLREVGRKFDRWLDMCYYQKQLTES